jgi:hypothetical protein
MKKSIFIFLFFILISFKAYSFDLFGLLDEKTKITECGNRIKEFKAFIRDARQCNNSDDCVNIEGACPLSCHFYVNKAFEKIASDMIYEVNDICKSTIKNCTKCQPYNINLHCRNKVCTNK